MRRVFRKKLEARGGIEPPIKVLQTFALPLGDRALSTKSNNEPLTGANSSHTKGASQPNAINCHNYSITTPAGFEANP
jgi:hypothetical protein